MTNREQKPWQGGTDQAFAGPDVFGAQLRQLTEALVDANREGCDIAELLSLAITHAAMELGGMDELLKYRLGSWEAAAVRSLETIV